MIKVTNTEYIAFKKQSGLSLIELLVAMIIGLFLLAGITTSYLSSKKSSVLRDQVSILEENGRAALEILANTLQHTGYRSPSLTLLENPFMTTKPKTYSCGSGFTSVLGINKFPENGTENNVNDTGDVIGITYIGDDNDDLNTDCSGLNLPEQCRVGRPVDIRAHQIHNAFFIDDNDNLQCAGSLSEDLETIAEGVENIQILFGINADNDPLKSVERYVNAVDVGSNWGQVVSIQVAVLVRTLNEVKPKAESKTFSLLDESVTTSEDRYQRAVFSTTINLRNL